MGFFTEIHSKIKCLLSINSEMDRLNLMGADHLGDIGVGLFIYFYNYHSFYARHDTGREGVNTTARALTVEFFIN